MLEMVEQIGFQQGNTQDHQRKTKGEKKKRKQKYIGIDKDHGRNVSEH